MFEVVLVKNQRSSLFGTYPTRSEADDIAETHRSTGYWDSVDVKPQ